jgi:integrase
MPRKPDVQWWESRHGFYARVRGKPVRVGDGPNDKAEKGPQFRAAVQEWGRLTARATAYQEPDGTTVRTLIDAWIQQNQSNWTEGSLRIRNVYLTPFVSEFGDRIMSSLTGEDLRAFCSKMREGHVRTWKHFRGKELTRVCRWSAGGVRNFIGCLRAACAWALDDGCLSRMPRGLGQRQTAPRSRREILLSEEQVKQLCSASRYKRMRQMVAALAETGARPSEIRLARGRDWDPKRGALVYLPDGSRPAGYHRHKTAGKGKPRIILFPPSWHEELSKRALNAPDAPLFPGTCGRFMGKESLRSFFRRMRSKLGLPGITPYTLRHTYATRWLLRGGTVETLAEQLGNTPKIIYHYYAHVCKDQTAIAAAVERFGLRVPHPDAPKN